MKEKIELRNNEIDELLGETPSWLTRWGISVFFGIIVIAVVFCCYFKYPVIVTAPTIITTEHPAIWVISKHNGKIDTILVRNNDYVESDQILAVINNSCKFEDVIALKSYLASIEYFVSTLDIDSIIHCSQTLNLAELQNDYLKLIKLLSEYQQFYDYKLHEISYNSILNELEEQRNYLRNLYIQKDLLSENEAIFTDRFKRDSMFFVKKIIQLSEYENVQQQRISGRIELSRAELLINSTKVNLILLEQKLNENRVEFNNQVNAFRNTIKSTYDQLISNVTIWESQYLVKSPVDGVISFSNIWSENQNVVIGDRIFAIVSKSPGKLIGKCNIPISGIGKIRENQSLIIKLESHPFLEFGVVHGKINNISKIPENVTTEQGVVRFMVAEVSLPQPLITSYNKAIPFSGELSGTAEITIEDLTLMQRFISPLKYILTDSHP